MAIAGDISVRFCAVSRTISASRSFTGTRNELDSVSSVRIASSNRTSSMRNRNAGGI